MVNNYMRNIENSGVVFIRNTKGSWSLWLGGHSHTFQKTNKNDSSIWRCSNRSCSGSLTWMEEDQTIIRVSDHTCQPDMYAQILETLKAELKQAVCDDLGPIPKIFENVMRAYSRNHDYDEIIPNYESVRDSLYRARKSYLNVRATVFTKVENVVLSEKLTEDFLLCNDGTTDKILIFCSSEAREVVKTVHHFFADGTFKSAPPPFRQLYTVHGLTAAGITPLIYCLLHNKEQHTYKRLFTLLRNSIPGFNPETFQTDYEIAAMNAIQTVFPNANIKGCFFHFAQALHKKAKLLNLSDKKTLSLFVALAHIPANLMIEAFQSIEFEVQDNPEGWNEFIAYFTKQWMNPNIINAVSMFDNPHRTINSVEGWHSRLNKRIKRKPNVYPFIQLIKNESIKYDLDIRRGLQHFPSNKKINKRQQIINDRVKKIATDYVKTEYKPGFA